VTYDVDGQAWTKKKGTGFYKLDFTGNNAVSIFNDKGDLLPSPQIDNYTTAIYAEHGITDRLTLVLNTPIWVSNSLSATSAFNIPTKGNSSIGDIDIAARIAISLKAVPLALTVQLGLPTGNDSNADGLNTGDGEFNQLVKVATGFGIRKLWMQTAVGFNNRSNDFSDEFRFDFEFGYKFLKERLYLILRINGVESMKNGSAKVSPTGLYSNDVGYTGYGPEFLYYVSSKKNIGISARLGQTFTSRARNVLAATAFSIGGFAEF
jgi:protein XagA